MPLTIKSLKGYRKELRDHHIEINGEEAFDPGVGIAASVRWLHQKRKLASIKLKREASWLEAVEQYKNVLTKKVTAPGVYKREMKQFLEKLELLGEK